MIALEDATELEAIGSFEIYSVVGFAGWSDGVAHLEQEVYVCWSPTRYVSGT